VESKRNTRRVKEARLDVWTGKAGDDDDTMAMWKAKDNPRRAEEDRLDVWRGMAGDNDTITV